MALATQCPHCLTSFRVANDQLKLHAGMVRCGACKQTFNGIEHLLAPDLTPRKKESSPTVEISPRQTDAADQINPSKILVEKNAATASTPQRLPETEQGQGLSQLAPDNSLIKSATTSKEQSKSEDPGTNDLQVKEVFEDKNAEVFVDTSPTNDQTDQTPIDQPQHLEENFQDSKRLSEPTNCSVHDLDVEVINSSSLDFDQSEFEETESETESESESDFQAIASQEFDSGTGQEEEIEQASEIEFEAQQQELIKQFSAQLETIAPELGVASEDKGSHSEEKLSNKLEFELTPEERELIDQAEHLHQLELQTRAALLDENAKEWSQHESETNSSALEMEVDDIEIPEPAMVNAKVPHEVVTPTPIVNKEAIESTKESESESLELEDESEITPDFVLLAEKKQRYSKHKRWAYLTALFVLGLGILGQSIYFSRSILASQFPSTKPLLTQACQRLQCKIQLPAERRMLELVGSELLILNEDLRISTLAFQIQNKSNTVQEWPVVELTLEDVRGKTVLQKIFKPSDYLRTPSDLPKGMPARSESNHKIHFELDSIKASNYLVNIFYP
ncbi:DUF3426 domain-containing protein [Undibacterium fentianense]|uniref:DUF3426 domain-containing protein n=1 Tax=Undibacterium fentianense TaxID=2828728 RepID=A0A941IBR0_9BURK|nr:DUF3426 domain-containing protein [Undibacterium fentianense]MBR7799354.1 DUF3426 domain-containing protein [Undibacterium fentianense]